MHDDVTISVGIGATQKGFSVSQQSLKLWRDPTALENCLLKLCNVEIGAIFCCRGVAIRIGMCQTSDAEAGRRYQPPNQHLEVGTRHVGLRRD